MVHWHLGDIRVTTHLYWQRFVSDHRLFLEHGKDSVTGVGRHMLIIFTSSEFLHLVCFRWLDSLYFSLHLKILNFVFVFFFLFLFFTFVLFFFSVSVFVSFNHLFIYFFVRSFIPSFILLSFVLFVFLPFFDRFEFCIYL